MKHILITAMSMTLGIMGASAATPLTYPQAPCDPTVVDDYFGMKVADPYRPLENDTAAATTAWVEAENAVTRAYLDAIPFRSDIHKRLTDLNTFAKIGVPYLENDGRYYFFANDGLRNQSVVYRRATLDAEPEVFLDPNTLSNDGTVALTGIFMSPDGKLTAYTISRSGSDWTEIYVMDTETGQLLDDHILWAKFTDAQWDGDGFYYSAYDSPTAGKEVSDINENHRVYYHKIGTPQSEDILVYSDPANPLHFHSAYVPEKSDYILITGSGEGLGNSIIIRNLRDKDADWITMVADQDFARSPFDMRDGKIYILSYEGAPRGRVMVADPAAPQRENWKVFIPEREDAVLASAQFSKDYLVLTYEKDAHSHIYLCDPATGATIKEIELPGIGYATPSVSHRTSDIFYSYTSFNTPSTGYRYDPATATSQKVTDPVINGVNLDDYVTEQVFYPSADGTMIPMFLTYRKGLERNGKNPVYLYGYGGFNISLPPTFSANRMLWLENGGIYAQANLRGGSEYGDQWHEAGTKMNKMNVFNDFIAAAEYLQKQGWTSPEYTVIEGASNGGLLIGACVNLRPELYRVALPRVGVMDMLRYHLFTIGWNWAPDYGTSADSPEMAAYLRSYSPLHNIRTDGTPYPAIMVTTADHDDRVVPAHSFKYAAALQAANTGNEPKLIRIDSKAGHGAGKPIAKVIDEQADIYSFIFNNLGIVPVCK